MPEMGTFPNVQLIAWRDAQLAKAEIFDRMQRQALTGVEVRELLSLTADTKETEGW